MRERRKKIWTHRFQTYLALRIAILFIAYQVGGWCLILFERQLIDGISRITGSALVTHWLLVLSGVIVALAALSIYDSVKFVHRLVGPIYRFRKAIQAVTAGSEVDLLTLRKGDFLQELKDEFNAMLHVLEQRGAVTVKTTKAKTEQGQPVSV